MPVVGVAKSGWALEQLQGARPGEPRRAHGRRRRGGVRAPAASACATSTATTATPRRSRALAARAGRRRHPLHYLAIPPSLFGHGRRAACRRPGCAGGRPRGGREALRPRPAPRRASSTATLHAVFAEDDIFRIDHFLGKEPVENLCLLPLRQQLPRAAAGTATTCAASRSRWPRTSGSTGRGAFYEEAGTIRDVVQNHLLQVLALLTWTRRRPGPRGACATRRRACCAPIRPLAPADVVRGQFDGYRDDDGRRRRTRRSRPTPPCGCAIDSWRWAGRADLHPGRQVPAR